MISLKHRMPCSYLCKTIATKSSTSSCLVWILWIEKDRNCLLSLLLYLSFPWKKCKLFTCLFDNRRSMFLKIGRPGWFKRNILFCTIFRLLEYDISTIGIRYFDYWNTKFRLLEYDISTIGMRYFDYWNTIFRLLEYDISTIGIRYFDYWNTIFRLLEYNISTTGIQYFDYWNTIFRLLEYDISTIGIRYFDYWNTIFRLAIVIRYFDYWNTIFRLLEYDISTIGIRYFDYWNTILRLLEYDISTIGIRYFDYWNTIFRLLEYDISTIGIRYFDYWNSYDISTIGIRYFDYSFSGPDESLLSFCNRRSVWKNKWEMVYTGPSQVLVKPLSGAGPHGTRGIIVRSQYGFEIHDVRIMGERFGPCTLHLGITVHLHFILWVLCTQVWCMFFLILIC